MKLSRLLSTALIVCFLLGIGMAFLTPPVSAGPDPCNRNCYSTYNCGTVCPDGLNYHVTRCYAPALLACEPGEAPGIYHCGCSIIGCAPCWD
jgi:hypothetical protein